MSGRALNVVIGFLVVLAIAMSVQAALVHVGIKTIWIVVATAVLVTMLASRTSAADHDAHAAGVHAVAVIDEYVEAEHAHASGRNSEKPVPYYISYLK